MIPNHWAFFKHQNNQVNEPLGSLFIARALVTQEACLEFPEFKPGKGFDRLVHMLKIHLANTTSNVSSVTWSNIYLICVNRMHVLEILYLVVDEY